MSDTFAQKIRTARLSSSDSQYDAAQKLGISETYYWKVESGRAKPSKGLIEKAAEAYRLELADLLQSAGFEPVNAKSADSEIASDVRDHPEPEKRASLGQILDAIKEIAARYELNSYPVAPDVGPWLDNPPLLNALPRFLEEAEERIRAFGEEARLDPDGRWNLSFSPTGASDLGLVRVMFTSNQPAKLVIVEPDETSKEVISRLGLKEGDHLRTLMNAHVQESLRQSWHNVPHRPELAAFVAELAGNLSIADLCVMLHSTPAHVEELLHGVVPSREALFGLEEAFKLSEREIARLWKAAGLLRWDPEAEWESALYRVALETKRREVPVELAVVQRLTEFNPDELTAAIERARAKAAEDWDGSSPESEWLLYNPRMKWYRIPPVAPGAGGFSRQEIIERLDWAQAEASRMTTASAAKHGFALTGWDTEGKSTAEIFFEGLVRLRDYYGLNQVVFSLSPIQVTMSPSEALSMMADFDEGAAAGEYSRPDWVDPNDA